MNCINATSLHRKSGKWGTQPLLTVTQSKKVTDPLDDESVGEPEEKQQVPPLRFAPVGMTNSLKGR
jgi:hypothetical protein